MDRDDASVSPSTPKKVTASPTNTTPTASTNVSPTAAATTPVAPSAAPLSASVSTTAPTPLSRSVSQQSAASSTRSHRSLRRGNGSRRTSSRVPTRSSSQSNHSPAPAPHLAVGSSSASVTSEDSKSLTSFPSFSPKAPSASTSPQLPPHAPAERARVPRLAGPTASTASLVDSLLASHTKDGRRSTSPSSSSLLQHQSSLLPVTAPSTSTASTSSVTAAVSARNALFEDAPPLSSVLPGSLHLTDDAHVARLIGKHGAVSLVRQLAEDLAMRDAQIATLRARAADRERCLRKIILECGLSSLDLETRLRTLEQEQEARVQSQVAQAQANATAGANTPATSSSASIPAAHARRVSDLVSDAMSDDNSLKISSDYYYNDATIRAASSAAAVSAAATSKKSGSNASNMGTTKGWKDYLWGGGTAKKSSNGSVSGTQTPQRQQQDQQQGTLKKNTAVRVTSGGDRRPTITDDFFQPPTTTPNDAEDARLARSNSRASSIASAATSQSSRKPSLASLALRLVGAGGSDSSLQDGSEPGTPSSGKGANTASAAASLRIASGAGSRRPGLPSTTIGRSSRATTLQSGGGGSVGPRSLMSMRRTTSSAVLNGAGAVAALNSASPQTIPGRGSGGSHANGSGSGGHGSGGGGSSGTQAHERWGEMMDASPAGDGVVRRTTYFPVEMDTILPLDVQPPTLTHMYNRYNKSGHLIDRFGFIYDQRRKKRQREAAQVAGHVKRGSRHSEMLDTGSGRASRASRPSPTMLDSSVPDDGVGETTSSSAPAGDEDRASIGDASSLRGSTNNDNDGANNRPASPTTDLAKDAASGGGASGIPKRWQDYLKIATFPTELLSHTPAMSDSRIEVITESVGGGSGSNSVEGGNGSVRSVSGDGSSMMDTTTDAGPKSPGFITSDGRGFVPPSTGAMAAATTAATTTTSEVSLAGPGRDTGSIASGTAEATIDNKADQKQLVAKERTPAQQQQLQASQAPKEDAEPVRLLLQQLSELHDNLQKERTVRWNEFLRKVRAERRREGEMMAVAAATAASEGGGSGSNGGNKRFSLHATAVMPETRLADGEIIGVAGLGNKGKLGRAKWNEFRALVLGGIPVVMRAKVWAECTGATSLRVPGMYDDLVADRGGADSDEETDNNGNGQPRHHHEDRADVVAQIQADIYRTLTDNIFFREGPGTAKLNEVLLAYARRNPDVGYCQGMNLIAANLLLVTPSAEDAFWLLASIIETILPVGYYDHSLAGSRADQQVLRAYVADVLPRLSAHFDALSIDLETMTFQWFLSVFTDCLSAEVLFRVWDVVFCLNDGSVFLFQVALALLKLNEAALLRCETPAEIYTYINHQMTNHAISIDGLIQASEALRKLVRREDVEARRQAALEAERALVAARAAAVEEAKVLRQQKIAAREEAARAAQATATAKDSTADAPSATADASADAPAAEPA
ncbi:hypothetical protein SBRCBS47491_005723 [Sporothrix bragantina]|uniref:Rab-GAP TBC domain-containing protein n=1 Tax=Sporothrix bragantina TaxID=671064 RepID=A0ABP0BZA9_9PEZI